GWPERPGLEADSLGPLPRANLSVKGSALTPHMRPDAPDRGREDASRRMRPLLRKARHLGAHLHIDMESLDPLETAVALPCGLRVGGAFREGPWAGLVPQASLGEAPGHPDRILEWASGSPRRPPLVVRLVKGAYWDHEIVQARQHGWQPP